VSANLIAEIKDHKIIVRLPNGKTFNLVPYVKTTDGDQQFFGIDADLERIVLCINDLAPIPTETIRQGFAARMMDTVNRAKASVELTKKVLEAFYAKEAKENKPASKIQTDAKASAVPSQDTSQPVHDGDSKA
jgi:hypothetical protein